MYTTVYSLWQRAGQASHSGCLLLSSLRYVHEFLHWALPPVTVLTESSCCGINSLVSGRGRSSGDDSPRSSLQQYGNKNQSNRSTGKETQTELYTIQLISQRALTFCSLGPVYHLHFRVLRRRAVFVLSVYELLTFNFASVLLTTMRTVSQFIYDIIILLSCCLLNEPELI